MLKQEDLRGWTKVQAQTATTKFRMTTKLRKTTFCGLEWRVARGRPKLRFEMETQTRLFPAGSESRSGNEFISKGRKEVVRRIVCFGLRWTTSSTTTAWLVGARYSSGYRVTTSLPAVTIVSLQLLCKKKTEKKYPQWCKYFIKHCNAQGQFISECVCGSHRQAHYDKELINEPCLKINR